MRVRKILNTRRTILNFGNRNSTSTRDVLKVSSLKILSNSATHFEYSLSTCAVVHTKIEYIVLNIGAACVEYFTLTVQCTVRNLIAATD